MTKEEVDRWQTKNLMFKCISDKDSYEEFVIPVQVHSTVTYKAATRERLVFLVLYILFYESK